MNHIVIMAGGSGTRFWPLSRRHRPKQLLPLWGDRTLLELTVDRLSRLAPYERLYIVAGGHLAPAIAAAVPEVPGRNILVEPCARNTLPCIALAAAIVGERDDEATLSVFPADHFIEDDAAFEEACALGIGAAEAGQIATMGVRPTRPETGYGYVRYGGPRGAVLEVEAFVEKPDLDTAMGYVEAGHYLWNAGIFFLSARKLWAEMDRQQAEMARAFEEVRRALASDDRERLSRAFAGLPSLSVDYGIMEGASDVVVIPASFGWSDVGHWGALEEVLPTDEQGNVAVGAVASIDTRGSVLFSGGREGKLLAVVGLDDVVVIDTEDATLVLKKADAQRVREVVASLEGRGRSDLR